MTDTVKTATDSPQANAPGMRSEIGRKWPKFTPEEISALKSKDDLVTEVQSKYSLDKAQAQKEVDSFARGRQL